MDRDDRIAQEAVALWMAIYREPPIVLADGTQMLDAMISTLPPPVYGVREQDEA